MPARLYPAIAWRNAIAWQNAVAAVILTCWLCCIAAAQKPAKPPSQQEPAPTADGTFLVLSDLHFNPFAAQELFPRLQQAPADQWPRILAETEAAGQEPGTDTSFALLQSTLDHAAQRAPRPDFILCPGDMLAHDWQRSFDRLAPGLRATDPEVFQRFTINAVRFLVAELRRRFPGVPILPAIGNEDSFCDDYALTPDGVFLRDFAATWDLSRHVPVAEREAFQQTFVRGGYYELPHPRVPKHRLVVLNSVFFSTEYFDACEQPHQQPSGEQLAWLEQRLSHAEQNGEQVWLLMHIPPGIDAFATAQSLRKNGPAVSFWHEAYTRRFLKLAARYKRTLQLAIAGHTHMDDFRLPRADGEPTVPFKLVPAVSPVFGNNPAYQVFAYRRSNGRVADYRTYFLPLVAEQRRGGDAAPQSAPQRPDPPDQPKSPLPGWREEYSFAEAYGYASLSAASVADLARRLERQPEVIGRFRTYYNSSAPMRPDSDPWPVPAAAMLEALPQAFRQRLDAFPPDH